MLFIYFLNVLWVFFCTTSSMTGRTKDGIMGYEGGALDPKMKDIITDDWTLVELKYN